MVFLSRLVPALLAALTLACSPKTIAQRPSARLRLGIERTETYLPLLAGKRVGLVVNHTSVFPNGRHLADSLLACGIKISTIFAPEHGFRGEASAGEHISNGKDLKTGLPIVSLYGANRKPTSGQLQDIDVVVFDIQDVGARFYTYTSTLHYVLEACGEQQKTCLVLDRPNPNGHYTDGPVLEPKFASFVGLNPVPIVHGCTVAELARMIIGEGWVSTKPDLRPIACENYTHATRYELPVAPSPNLPNAQSIRLYPSICLFEPTVVSVGRGTDMQFQVIGGPDKALGRFQFTPADKPGAMNPVNEGKTCYGLDLRKAKVADNQLNMSYLIDFYRKYADKKKFFMSASFFDKLAGTDQLRQQLESGATEAAIRKSWQPGLEAYRAIRKKYLLYSE